MARPTISKHTATEELPAVAPRLPVEYAQPKEAAEFLGVSLATLISWRRQGKGPDFVRVSDRRIVYPMTALRQHQASRINVASPAPPRRPKSETAA